MTRGTVVFFDETRGLGRVSLDDGAVLDFHCAAIVDGTRSIPDGATVRFDVVPGHGGRWEAAGIEVVN